MYIHITKTNANVQMYELNIQQEFIIIALDNLGI